jgi:hypothetical protein
MTEIDVLRMRDEERGVERSQLQRNDEPCVADPLCDIGGNLDFVPNALLLDRLLVSNEKDLTSPIAQRVF